MPSGSAMVSRKYVPSPFPVTRRTTSPTSQPKVTAWYPWVLPGVHHGRSAASADTIASQS